MGKKNKEFTVYKKLKTKERPSVASPIKCGDMHTLTRVEWSHKIDKMI